jgi:NADH-quinone oxidoreductase subunit B
VTKLDELANWYGRIVCGRCRSRPCWHRIHGDEASKYDIAAGERCSSVHGKRLLIVAGRVVMKLPVLQRIWQQMHEPKWCI